MVLLLESHAQNGALLPPSPPQWPLLVDADQDGLTDGDEILLWLNPLDAADGLSDLDGDGLSLAWEWQIDTAPDRADTDADGWSDSDELLVHGTDPRDATSRPADAAQVQTSGASPQPSVLMNVVSTTATATAPPSLMNGDFTNASAPRWYDATKSTSYQGSGFKWGEGTASGWTAYRGSSIEIWQTNGQSFVELDGNKGSYGIKQPIKDVRAGTLLLTWKQSGRNNPLARSDAYYVQIYYQNTSGAVQVISKTPVYQGFSKTAWTDNAHVFTIKEQDIQAAAGAPIYVAFIPEDLNTYGTLIDEVKLLPVDLVPDYNRDGKIDQADRGKVSEENPYRFWVNDDDDRVGEKRGKNSNDIPGSRSSSSNGVIDGIRDLIDFFPLHLDLQTALKVLPSAEYRYFLKHAEGALKFHEVVETKLDQNHDNQGPAAYLKNVAKATSLDGSTLKHANSSGVELSAGILGSFGKGEGVLLCEITQQTQTPLILEIRKNDGTSVAEIKFPLKTSGVEDMYRHVNLRPAAGGAGGRATETAEPSNYPDDIPGLTSNKYLVFVHGYNVNGEQARGWHSEFFKRMWWSGSLARFVGVSWHGDESQGGAGMTTSPVRGIIPDDITPNYHANVINAFQTADDLTSSLAWIDGEVSIGAHSLGNMVVGLAIQDHGFQAENYFLVDAAVAMESYNAGETKQANMTNGDWVDYDERLWASEWHQLPWPQNDPRKKLTWRGRLGDVVSRTNAYNFYSSEEEVLNNATASQSSTLLGAAADDLFLDWIIGGNVKGEHTWALQEILKGKGITGEVLGSIYGGWKFNYKFLSWPVDDPPPAEINEIYAALFETFSVPPLPFWKMYNTRQLRSEETSELAGQTQQLMAKPFFDPPPAGKTHAELLAQAFPARTNPAGRNPVGVFGPNDQNNFNMATLKNGSYSADTNESRWRHSDIRDVGYLYTWKVYDKFRELGELNQ